MQPIVINETIPGTLSPGSLEVLGRLARAVPKNGLIVEIGALYGAATWTLAKNCDESVRIISIDDWCERAHSKSAATQNRGCLAFSKEAFKAYTSDCSNIVTEDGQSADVLAGVEGDIHLIVDTGSYPQRGRNDLLESLQKLRPGGMLAICEIHRRRLARGAFTREASHAQIATTAQFDDVYVIQKASQPPTGTDLISGLYAGTPHALVVSVKLHGNEIVAGIPGAWAGSQMSGRPIRAVKIEWADPEPKGQSATLEARCADGSIRKARLGIWMPTPQGIADFRVLLTSADDNLLAAYEGVFQPAGAPDGTRGANFILKGQSGEWLRGSPPPEGEIDSAVLTALRVQIKTPGEETWISAVPTESMPVDFQRLATHCSSVRARLRMNAANADVEGDLLAIETGLKSLAAAERRSGAREKIKDFLRNKVISTLADNGIATGRMAEIGGARNAFVTLPNFEHRFLSLVPDPADPRVLTADITNCPHIESNSFDVIFSVSVLEHVKNIYAAAAEITRILKPGGVTIHSVPFSYFFHGAPIDYWRMTTSGLEAVFPELTTIECEFLGGNRRRNNFGAESNPVDGDGGPQFSPDAFGGWRENWSTLYIGRKEANGAALLLERRYKQTAVDLVAGLRSTGLADEIAIKKASTLLKHISFDNMGKVSFSAQPVTEPLDEAEIGTLWRKRGRKTISPGYERWNLIEICRASGLL